MPTQGRPAAVIITASLAGLMPVALMAPYCAAKYGVVGMTEALNAELPGRGIHVSAICLGMINTPIVRAGIMRGHMAAIHAQVTATYARRGASPDAVARAVLHAIRTGKVIITVPARKYSSQPCYTGSPRGWPSRSSAEALHAQANGALLVDIRGDDQHRDGLIPAAIE